MQIPCLTIHSFDTPLGTMRAIADETHLYLLEFVDKANLEAEIKRLTTTFKVNLVPGVSPPIKSIQNELKAYFEGTLKIFKTPWHLLGSPFQKQVWIELLCTPYGQTRSYSAQAQAIGKPSAFRAVANANGANHFVIIIPCHRIINSNGQLGGYSSGLNRKEWLIQHELTQMNKAR